MILGQRKQRADLVLDNKVLNPRKSYSPMPVSPHYNIIIKQSILHLGIQLGRNCKKKKVNKLRAYNTRRTTQRNTGRVQTNNSSKSQRQP
jgi:hypothetical protein